MTDEWLANRRKELLEDLKKSEHFKPLSTEEPYHYIRRNITINDQGNLVEPSYIDIFGEN